MPLPARRRLRSRLGLVLLGVLPAVVSAQQTAATLAPRLQMHHGLPINAVAMSPDGKLIASASAVVVDARGGKAAVGEVKLWNAQTGELTRTLTVDNDNVKSLAFSPSGNLLAAGGGNTAIPHRPIRITVWDVTSGKVTRTLDGYDEDVTDLAFLGDGAGVVAVGYTKPQPGKVLRMWETASNDAGWTLKWPIIARHRFARSPTGDLLMAVNGYVEGPWDRDIQRPGQAVIALWNLGDKTQLAMRAGGTMPFTQVSVSLDGRVVAGANAWGVEAWGIPIGVHFTLTSDYPTELFREIALSPDGTLMALVSLSQQRSSVRVWDMNRKALIAKAFEGAGAPAFINDLVFSPDGSSLVTGDSNGNIILWKVK